MNRRTTASAVLAAALLMAGTHAAAQVAAPPNVRAAAVIAPSPNATQMDAMFTAWDSDHDGTLSRTEFRRGASSMRTAMVDRRLQAQFNAVDADKSGSIDGAEYAKLVLVKRAGNAAPPLSTFDANRDQGLNFAEYTDMVHRLAPAPASAAPRATPASPAGR